MQNNWHAKSEIETLKELRSDPGGLSFAEAAARLKTYGPNKLPEAKPDNPAAVFLRQFQSPLIYILIAAALIIFLIGETSDALVILAVLLFNAVVGSIQEGRARNTLLALKKFISASATVLRADRELIVPDFELVPGDIIILREGEKVPADARIFLSRNLSLDESMLTGESEPSHKTEETMEQADLPAPDRKNMAFKGSNVLSGSGKAIVVGTGLNTVVGQIADKISAMDTEIPFKANVRHLSRLVIGAVAGISLALFVFGVATGQPSVPMFITVVALTVSIIPEGLPIVMTLVLAMGVWRMSRQNVLVKRLQAVEALGQAGVIAVDKTGTITKNEMVAQKIYASGRLFEVSGSGYEAHGEFSLNQKPICPPNHPELLLAGKLAAYCANARVIFDEELKQWRVAGDPTEAAMNVLAQKLGFKKDELEQETPLVVDYLFDYKLKYHAAAYAGPDHRFMAVAGAPEVILRLSKKIWRDGKSFSLADKTRLELEAIFLKMAEQGMRVVALAESRGQTDEVALAKGGALTFVAFLGMKDPLRPEIAESVGRLAAAGVRMVMITGDHTNTARAIAEEAGILCPGGLILTGQEIDDLTDKQLAEKICPVSVFARVTPEHKLRIIRAFKERGETIAMTGDGVNDAPSLAAADLGVAMGRIGTEVAKEASDIILLDDNMNNVISAVSEGRNIYKTIKKVILYLFSTGAGEALTIAGAIIIGLPLPLLPAQIIWLNFVTDGFLDVALAMEPKEKNLLSSRFKRPGKFIVDKLMGLRILFMSLPMAAGGLYLFNRYLAIEPEKALTVSLTSLAVFQWFNAWNCRSEEKSVFRSNPLSNKYLVGATLVVISLQLLAVYNPLLQKVLHTAPLDFADWLLIVPIAASIIIIEEIRKSFTKKNN